MTRRIIFCDAAKRVAKIFCRYFENNKKFFLPQNIRIVANFRPIPLHFVVFSGHAVKVADILTQNSIEVWKIRSKKPKKP